MKDIICRVVENIAVTGDVRRITVTWDGEGYTPGQFVMVKILNDQGILLRRPFAVCRMTCHGEAPSPLSSPSRGEEIGGGELEIVYKVVGKGTEALTAVKAGDPLNVLGPLGKGFVYDNVKKAVLVAGGYGITSFVGLSERLAAKGIPFTLYYGGRSKADLIKIPSPLWGEGKAYPEPFGSELRAELRSRRGEGEVKLATEDGSAGRKGLVTDIVEFTKDSTVYVAGPMGMIKNVAAKAIKAGVPCQVSVEEKMGCGFGVCLGCAVLTKDGKYVRSCTDGPVFEARELKW